MNRKLLLLSLSIFLLLKNSTAQIINIIAGIPGQSGYTGDNGQASQAKFSNTYSIDVDKDGNLYISDAINCVIRKINASGIVTTIAGNGSFGYAGDGGPAVLAQFKYTGAIAVDKDRSIFVCEPNSYVIRKIDIKGIITTIAGNGSLGYAGDGGLAIKAQVYATDICVDNAGNIYFADYAHARIRKINKVGIISTIAGNGIYGRNGDNGLAILAEIIPRGIAIDNSGNLYIADNNSSIRKINSLGIITTIVGRDGIHGYAGDFGSAITALLHSPYDMDIDASGNVYIADHSNNRIRKVDTSGKISTIAGTGVAGYTGDGGLATLAQITYPTCLVIADNDALYLSDPINYTVRKISGCLNTISSSVDIVATKTSICQGDPISFKANPTNGGINPIFQWKINGFDAGANSSTFTNSFFKDRDIVSCVMISSIACTSPIISNNTIEVSIKNKPVVQLTSEITIEPGASVRLNPTNSRLSLQYKWTPSEGLSNTSIANPLASPVNTTTYQLKVTNTSGCMDSAKIKVIIYKKIYMPSAFTPNADGKNDIFRIPIGTTFDLMDFSIYNRWGKIIFTTTDITRGWDGTYKGVQVNSSVFIYKILGKDKNQEVFLKGTIILIR